MFARLDFDNKNIHNSDEPLWEKKGQINVYAKPTSGVTMVTVLLIYRRRGGGIMNQNVCIRTWPAWWSGFVRLFLKELQGYFNDVVSVEFFCSSVCPFDNNVLSLLFAEHCWYDPAPPPSPSPPKGWSYLLPYVTNCNTITNDFILFLVSFAKCLTACIPCSDNTSSLLGKNLK